MDAVNPCGLAPEDRLLLSMSPHVLVPGAWEQEERNAAHKQQQQQPAQRQAVQPLEADLAAKLSLDDSPRAQQAVLGLRSAVADLTEQQRVSSATPPTDQLSGLQTAAALDPLSADPLGAEAPDAAADAPGGVGTAEAGCGAEGGSRSEPEFTDPLRRRTLQGDEGLLGDNVGLSEDAMVEQEEQDAAAMAALADLPRATQGLQLYDR